MTIAPPPLCLIRDGEHVEVRLARLPAGSTAFAVVNGIRQAVMRGSLRAGDRLADDDGLATTFGISRRLVRRGMLILVDAGQAAKDGPAGWRLA